MEKGLTRTQVCRALGVSEKTLYAWERRGKIEAPPRNHRGWRVYGREQVEAIRALLRQGSSHAELEPTTGHDAKLLEGLSARNQLRGVVTRIEGDGILSEVTLRVGDGQEIVSVVTSHSVDRLGLHVGDDAMAVIKSTEVMLFR